MSSLNPYHTGEHVRITIDATVTWSDSGEIEYEYRSQLGTVEGKAALDSDAVKVERIAPAEWPPRVGDLWRDRDGDLWFVQGDSDELNMVGTGAWIESEGPEYLARTRAPLTLVHREEATP